MDTVTQGGELEGGHGSTSAVFLVKCCLAVLGLEYCSRYFRITNFPGFPGLVNGYYVAPVVSNDVYSLLVRTHDENATARVRNLAEFKHLIKTQVGILPRHEDWEMRDRVEAHLRKMVPFWRWLTMPRPRVNGFGVDWEGWGWEVLDDNLYAVDRVHSENTRVVHDWREIKQLL